MSSSQSPRTLHPAEYSLRLSTGEQVEVSEFDSERHPELADQAVRAACASVLDRVPSVPLADMEAAKVGDDRALRAALKAQPAGALQMVKGHRCSLFRECAMRSDRCSTRRVRRGRPDFPECWEFGPDGPAGDAEAGARAAGTAVVHAWRSGRYALLVIR